MFKPYLQRASYLAAILSSFVFGCSTGPSGTSPVSEIPVKNLKNDGRYYVGGEPTPQGLKQLRNRGVMTIIDLRQEEEISPDEIRVAEELGMRYYNIPMKPNEMTPQQADEFLLRMSGTGDAPVLIHCAGGSRAAAMYGLQLGASGACSADDAIERALSAGLKNEKLANDLRARLQPRGQCTVPPFRPKSKTEVPANP